MLLCEHDGRRPYFKDEGNQNRGKSQKYRHISCINLYFIYSDLNPIAFLTNVDRVCQETFNDITNVFHSKEIYNKVTKSDN